MKDNLELENNNSLHKFSRARSWNLITNLNTDTIAIILMLLGTFGLTVS
jgi:hypothetical protein